jgi:hypothetical protein
LESSSSEFLFLLRLSGEAAAGGEFVREEPETCSNSEIFSEEPTIFSDSAGSLSKMEVSCESSVTMARSGTSLPSGREGREEKVWWFCRKKKRVSRSKFIGLAKRIVQLEEKELTDGGAWAPLNGSTRQEEGSSLFLLKEVKRRTSFFKSFKGRSSETLSASSAPE